MPEFKIVKEKITRIWTDIILKRFRQISGGVSLCGLCFGIFFWLFEAFLHTRIFGGKSYLNEVFFPETHELWMRSLATGLIYILGFASQFLINKGKRTEKELKLSNEMLNKIFQTAADGMRVVDMNFKVLDVNDTFVKMSGIERKDAIGKNCYEVFWGERCQTDKCPMIEIRGGARRCVEEVVKVRNDGIEIPCIVTATAYTGDDEELIGIVEDFKDMGWYHEKKNRE